MLIEPHRVRIDPDSELAHLLDQIGEMPILLEKNGTVYRLTKEEDNWQGYDAESVKSAIRKATGTWAHVDADKFMAAIYHAREAGTRAATRP
jgi:hypothetical protein